MDAFEDVILQGKDLVSDNPDRWAIPRSLSNASSLFAWWDEVVETDDKAFEVGLSRESRTLLLYLEAMYQQQVALNSNSPHDRAKVRSVVRHIVQTGLTISQTALLVSSTPTEIVRWLYCDQTLDDADVERRLDAEALMRRELPLTSVMQATGLSKSQALSMRKMLGLELPHLTAKPLNLRERALQMRHDGMTNVEIREALLTDGHDISTDTISQWWHRYGKRSVA
jgi:hypothetical protein